MAVVKIEGGVIVQTWRDVKTVADAVAKYGFSPSDLVEADHPPGTLYDGSSFSPPSPPPPPEPTATGAQMVDQAEAQNKLDMLTAALTASEMAVFLTRRRIVAGSNFAEVLRARLNVSASAMASFIAAAAVRSEV